MSHPSPVSPDEVLDLRRLRAIRKSKKLSQAALAEALGIIHGYYGPMELGKVHMRLWMFRRLCIILDLDPLEICELLRLPTVNRRDIQNFRAACRRLGTTPAKALADFMKTFIRLSKEKES
jgi:transcriptional regulator with XRE-family HTH domain